jgi:hypothetical protein
MPESPTETSPQRLPQTVGKRLAALSLVGAVMVAVPLLQLLRYQGSEAESLAAARMGLDPVGRAVDVQRGLLAHRDAAAQVLIGHQNFEPERQLRQGEVDERLTSLATTLASGPWQRAISESDALREDWLSLARQFAGHSLAASESDQAHRLLIEQTLQVIDLVADAGAPHAAATVQHLQPTLAVAHALPRLAWQIEQLSQQAVAPADDLTRQRDLAMVEAGLARTLGMLNAALVAQPRPALADAGAAAGAAADRYFHLLRAARTGPQGEHGTELRHAAVAARHAQFALFNQAQADAAEQLRTRGDAVQVRSSRLIVAMLTLGAMALILAAGTWRSLRRLAAHAQGIAAADTADAHLPSLPQQHTGALLDRLRQGRRSGDRTRRDSKPAEPSRF